MNKNNFISVTRSSLPSKEEYFKEISDLWDSRWLTNSGEKHMKLNNELTNYLKVKNLSLFTNGHLALETAIEVLDLKGEIITTPFTFVSTTNAIIRKGLKPVFCDINEKDYTINVDLIEGLITKNTSAILAVHVYGNVCDVKRIEEIAKKYNLKVLYDCAHAFGIEYDGKGIGNYGDISMFSFHATKVFNTIEGGALTYNDPLLRDKIESIKNFGITSKEQVSYIGTNAKMNEFQAAMGLCNLKYIDEEMKKRKYNFNKYDELLLENTAINLNNNQINIDKNYSYYVIQFKKGLIDRDNLYNKLLENNIQSRKYFYPLTSQFEAFDFDYEHTTTPIAQKIAESILCLPMYSDLSIKSIEKICNILNGSEVR